MKITDKDRLDFLEKMNKKFNDYEYEVSLAQVCDPEKDEMYIEIQISQGNFYGKTFRKAIDNAIMAMRERN